MSVILAVHVPIAGMALLPVLFGFPAVLYPMHIAFLELMIDPACSVAFENEPPEADVMQRSARDPNAALFGGWPLMLALMQGIGVLQVAIGAYAWTVRRLAEPEARAFAFTTLVIANLALIFSSRSRTRSFLKSLRSPNTMLWIVTGMTLGFLTLSLYLPFFAGAFRFAPLSLSEQTGAVSLSPKIHPPRAVT